MLFIAFFSGLDVKTDLKIFKHREISDRRQLIKCVLVSCWRTA